MTRSRWGSGIVVLIAAAALAGCGGQGQPVAGPGAPGPQEDARVRQQARDALDRWARAVADAGGQQQFVPIGDPMEQVGSWEEAVGGANKAALIAGRLVAVVALPTEAPPQAEIRWEDGTVRSVRAISATTALQRMVASGHGDCQGCAPLEVTSARLTTGRILTSRGPATVPVWEYTLRGTAVRVTWAAIDAADGVKVSPPPWDAGNPPAGLQIESAVVTADGRRLTVHFTGSPGPASQPCGIDYTAEAVEAATAVAVIVDAHPHGTHETCAMVGMERTATAALAEPLGGRAVLEVRQGLPVPVTTG
jgi:hypothetical protein